MDIPFDLLQTLIATQLEIAPETVRPDTDLREDLAADDHDLLELILAFEDEFQITLSAHAFDSVRTVGEIHHLLQELQAQ